MKSALAPGISEGDLAITWDVFAGAEHTSSRRYEARRKWWSYPTFFQRAREMSTDMQSMYYIYPAEQSFM